MTVQSSAHSLQDHAITYFWWFEQKFATLLAVVFGTVVGLAHGSLHASKSLYPHFTSVDGAKKLYYGDPAATLSSQSRAYVKDSFAAAKLKPSGYDSSSTPSSGEKTALPTLSNGDYSSTSSTAKTSEIKSDYMEAPPSKLYNTEDTVPEMNAPVTTHNESSTTTPLSGIGSPDESEGESETDDDVGSEYTATSSTPTTPRGSVLAAPSDATNGKKDKKKRRKRLSKGFKKLGTKIADALTPGSSTTH